ncbi:SRPBCC family protein [Mycolicibacterium sp. YH-1]|uniref:SRPBCC family protein n=1 Tax=Mycolicibacterium sp. YH-1 TaxID=2908837 RepID=UPI001F4C314B|nr:SRPBCC family protein [Mycolicibacterium sp. YH-1]UNB52372.1 SRPBCC family protein [Mycolicibacterium sp. YH-1]HET7740556.1 SRPBCC family protein [Mycobacterium sp.]
MTPLGPASAQASMTITAAPEAVYALITDLPTMAALAEETDAMEWHQGDSATPGAVFKGHNSNGGRKWTTMCTVTHAEPGRTFGFDVKSLVIPVAHWRYDIAPAEGGCTVTEQTWDRRPGWFRKVAGLATGVSDRESANAQHIRLTLERLKAKAEA